jgi:nitrogen fixation/metabolism regulation signal transduction histidine kinase
VVVTTVDAGDELIKDVAVTVQGDLARVHVGMSLQVINDSLRQLVWQLLPFAAALLALGALAAFAVASSITRPLAELADAANRLGQGRRDVQVTLKSRDEIGELASAFNRMTQELSQQQHQLEALNQSLEQRIEVALQELRLRDQALIAQNRLAAMGEMINNIAHQWRQPLNNISLIVQNMKYLNGSGALTQQELAQDVDSTMELIQFMSRTIDDFRNFFRQDKQKQPFSINQTVAKTVALLAPSLTSHNITVQVQQQEEVQAEGYANEYTQVLLNVIANAKEALITREVPDAAIELVITAEAGRSVVTISDNAGGIPDDVLPKIFDPYFTTKHQAHGTGIGLYMSKVIIEQNMGGSLTARNTATGAAFRLEL